jgi:glycosyltransferase involved in cell wall biosynthesis
MHFTGGAERLMTGLASGLADSQTIVELVTGLCHNAWRNELCKKTGHVSVKEVGRTAPGSLEFWLSVNGFARALAKLIDPQTDVVVTSSFPSSLASKIFTENRHVKVVHYLHEAPMVLHDKEGLKVLPVRLRLFYRAISLLYARDDIEAVARSDTIIANSQLSRRANAEAYGIDESRIEVVYPGVNVAEGTAPSASAPKPIIRDLRQGVPVIFFPRGTQFWRNPEISLQALARLQFPFQAVFTGGASYEANCLVKRAKALGIMKKVLWIRELSNENLGALYSQSSVVVSIPRRQPFGLIPLEALIHGAPPIISRSSGVSEVLRNGLDAIQINECETEELVNAIESLIWNEGMRKSIVSNGRRTILERLTLARFVKEMREKISN